MRFPTKALLSTGLLAAALTASPLSAGAATAVPASSNPVAAGQLSTPTCLPTTLTAAQQLVMAELTNRVGHLDSLLAAVDDTSNALTPTDRQTLQNDISTVELPGIQGLIPRVQAATSCSAVRQVAHAMVWIYRVYLVMTPQTHLTVASDWETSIESTFVSLEPTLVAAIQSAAANGLNVTAARAAYSDLVSQVTAAQTETNGVSARVLAQTPAGSPGNWGVFVTARGSTTAANGDLESAHTDAVTIEHDLAI